MYVYICLYDHIHLMPNTHHLQNANTIDMLNTMVWTAAKWMWLGMPLQQLKIVIYSRNPFDPDAEAEECLKHFQLAKEKIRKIKRFPVVSIRCKTSCHHSCHRWSYTNVLFYVPWLVFCIRHFQWQVTGCESDVNRQLWWTFCQL